MNRRQYITSLLALAAFSATLQAAPDEASAAREAATVWIQKIDTANYSGSWESAASVFKGAVSVQQWEKAAKSVRAPLGSVRKRTEKSATNTRTLPGAPEGQYVVFQYDTGFENKAATAETVTVTQDRDGSWRVAGYFIK
jgi:Protein of unknown function (DUF4019)